jgi:hypothetical protein
MDRHRKVAMDGEALQSSRGEAAPRSAAPVNYSARSTMSSDLKVMVSRSHSMHSLRRQLFLPPGAALALAKAPPPWPE